MHIVLHMWVKRFFRYGYRYEHGILVISQNWKSSLTQLTNCVMTCAGLPTWWWRWAWWTWTTTRPCSSTSPTTPSYPRRRPETAKGWSHWKPSHFVLRAGNEMKGEGGGGKTTGIRSCSSNRTCILLSFFVISGSRVAARVRLPAWAEVNDQIMVSNGTGITLTCSKSMRIVFQEIKRWNTGLEYFVGFYGFLVKDWR